LPDERRYDAPGLQGGTRSRSRQRFRAVGTITPANQSDAETLIDSVAQAQLNLDAAGSEATIERSRGGQRLSQSEHAELADDLDIRTYIPEPKRRYRYHWIDKVNGSTRGLCMPPTADAW